MATVQRVVPMSTAALKEFWGTVSPAFSQDPTYAWQRLRPHLAFGPAISVTDPANTPKPPGAVRLVCISDTHNRTADMPPLPEGDILVHAGDFSGRGITEEILDFAKFLKEAPFRHKVVIAGNHDLTFDVVNYDALGRRFHRRMLDCNALRELVIEQCTYLEDSACEIEGVSFYGAPWQPWFGDWGFNLERGEPCAAKWRMIPAGVDVLITHGPPLGHGDLTSSDERAGCVDLLKEIETRIQPQLHVFGHIHEGYGVTTNGTTVFANASICDLSYRPSRRALVFDVVPRGHARAAAGSEGHKKSCTPS